MSATTTSGVTISDFRLGMSRLAGGVSVIATGTAADPAGRRGMTATAVCSLCAEPPSLVVCLNHAAGTRERLVHNGVFSVNVLAGDDLDVARTFAGLHGTFGAERFSSGDWSPGTLGVPVLGSALASFECRVAESVEHGTHALLIGHIESIRWADEAGGAAEPLLYYSQRFHGLGTEVGVTGGPTR
ncbi:flavin reductase family protein [Streptomyces sp. YKOK-J1]